MQTFDFKAIKQQYFDQTLPHLTPPLKSETHMSARCQKFRETLFFFAIFQGFEENGVICAHMGLTF